MTDDIETLRRKRKSVLGKMKTRRAAIERLRWDLGDLEAEYRFITGELTKALQAKEESHD